MLSPVSSFSSKLGGHVMFSNLVAGKSVSDEWRGRRGNRSRFRSKCPRVQHQSTAQAHLPRPDWADIIRSDNCNVQTFQKQNKNRGNRRNFLISIAKGCLHPLKSLKNVTSLPSWHKCLINFDQQIKPLRDKIISKVFGFKKRLKLSDFWLLQAATLEVF